MNTSLFDFILGRKQKKMITTKEEKHIVCCAVRPPSNHEEFDEIKTETTQISDEKRGAFNRFSNLFKIKAINKPTVLIEAKDEPPRTLPEEEILTMKITVTAVWDIKVEVMAPLAAILSIKINKQRRIKDLQKLLIQELVIDYPSIAYMLSGFIFMLNHDILLSEDTTLSSFYRLGDRIRAIPQFAELNIRSVRTTLKI